MTKDAKGRSICLVVMGDTGTEEIEIDLTRLHAIRFKLGEIYDDKIDIRLDNEETMGIYIMGGEPLIIFPHSSNTMSMFVNWHRDRLEEKKGE